MLIRDIIPPRAKATVIKQKKIQKQTPKKTLAFLTILFLILQFFAELEPVQALVAISSGNVTQANMRLSIVANTAFVDFSSAGALTSYLGYKLVITSVTDPTKSITGYIKAAGTGETYGSEQLWNNPTFEGTYVAGVAPNWVLSKGTASEYTSDPHGGLSAQQISNPASNTGLLYESSLTQTSGKLFKASVWGKMLAGNGGKAIWSGTSASSPFMYFTSGIWTQGTTYCTQGATGGSSLSLQAEWGSSANANQVVFDDASVTQVLTPSTTGVTITDTANGTNYAWTTEDTGFNRNDTTYTYAIYPGSVSSTISDANTHSYQLIDCANTAGQLGVDVTAATTLQNYTVVRCPAGAFQFEESATLTNSIGTSTSNDITIASGKTVTGTYNLFNDAAKAGSGTYSDAGNTTKWSSDPLFVSASDFHLQSTSPAIDTGTNLSLTSDYAGTVVPQGAGYDIGAYEYTQTTSPTISLSSPAGNSNVSGNSATVSASASASSPASISSVQFLLDGSNLGSAVTSAPYSVSWNTTQSSNGSHTLSAIATDNYGNTAAAATVIANVRNGGGGGYLPPSNAYANWLAQASPVPTPTPSPPAGSPQANSPAPPTQAETGSTNSP